ncbi:MAG: hypothetical protein JOZ69_03485, partial [Myxococcales bacterium]|nr:hypothetical protein [Myxococcales bacterium]
MKPIYLLPLVLVSAHCVADGPPEAGGQAPEAVTSGGVGASLSVRVSGSTYSATMTVSNGSNEPISNWQVLVNMGPRPSDQNKMLIYPNWQSPSGAAVTSSNSANQAFFNDLGNGELFAPTPTTAHLAPGGSVSITWNGDWNGTTPWILSVDGVPSGTALAGNPADGLDPIALSAASAAMQIAYDYERGKLGNNGDPNYALYDQTLWSAQSFRVAAGNATIEFDPGAPGYAFVPTAAKADLAFAQLDPTVASYLTAGLVSCFSVSDGSYDYGFRADFLKGFTYPAAHSGTVTNKDGSIDRFTVTGNVTGQRRESVSVSASSGPTSPDPSFGVLRYLDAQVFPTFSSAVYPKFQGTTANIGIVNPGTWHGRYRAACSPFNGPGGSNNPYFVMNNNGSANVPAWFVGQGSQSCQNGCTASFTADPVPYAEPGAYYDTAGALVGTQSNPYVIA